MATIKYLADIDLTKNSLNNARIQNLSTAPSNPVLGQIYYDTDTDDLNVWNGAWIQLGATGAGDIESVVAGAGLTGGASSGDATLNVVGGTGITANANDIAIDSTVATLAGSQTLTNKTIAASQVTEISNLTAGEGAQLENIGSVTISPTQWGYLGAASGAITNTDTNTQLSSEQVQDIVGAMTTGNTESGITVTYQDADGTLDFTVGTLNQDTTGEAAEAILAADATTLATPRAIFGQNFDGSAAVTGNATLGGIVMDGNTITGVDDSGEFTDDDAHIMTSAAINDKFAVINANTTGLAGTATALATTRAIQTNLASTSGANFNGTAAITPGVTGTLAVGNGGTGAANLNHLVQIAGTQTITGAKTFSEHVSFADGKQLRWAGASVSSPTTNDVEVVATTITLDAASDIQLEGNTTVTGNFSVSGTLNVDGSTTTIDSTTVAIADSMLKLAKDQANTADVVDFGFYGQYGVSGTHKYAGIFRDGSTNGDPFTFFDGLQAEPGATVNTAGTGYDLADISAGKIISADGFTGNLQGNVTGNASGSAATVTSIGNLTGHITSTNRGTVLGSFTVAQLSAALSNASISGNNTGDQTTVSGSSGSCTGNAATATKLATTRAINGVNFDGTAPITVTAAAGTLSGNTLKSTVVTSSLTSVGTIGTGVWNATEIGTSKTAAKVTSIVAGAGIDVNNSGVGAVTVTAETASATNPGVVELATTAEALAGADTTRAVTAAGLAARSYRAAIGDGSATAIAVTHSLGTKDVMVQMYDASSFETVMAQVVRNTTAQVTVTFNTAPTSGDVIILITKID